jgi:hypothetical protein
MGLEGLSYIAAIVSAVLGGGQLLTSVLPFFHLKGRYESLQQALRGVRSPKDERYSNVYGNLPTLIKWLDFGEVILGPVQQRVMRQAVLAGGALVTVIASIPINFGASKTGIEWHDIAAIAFACLIPNLTFLNNWFLPQSEREFLRNFCALEDAFYRREVKPKIDLFNKVVSQEFPLFRAATDEEYAQLLDKLRKSLRSPISAIAEGKPSKK